MQHGLIHVSTVEACYVLMFLIHTFTPLTLCLCYYIRNDPGWKRERVGEREKVHYILWDKVGPQYCFVIYYMARRASAVGLFSNFERLVELSESTSGVFLHIYILIIGKPLLCLSLFHSLSLFQIKFFLLPFSIILCFLVRLLYVFLSVPSLSNSIQTPKKRNIRLEVNNNKIRVPNTFHYNYFPIISICNST